MYAQFAFAVRNWLNRSAFGIWHSEHYKEKKGGLVSFLFSLCIIGVCSLKKITSLNTGHFFKAAHVWKDGFLDILTKGLHLSFASFWESRCQHRSSLCFFFSLCNGICVSKFPSSEDYPQMANRFLSWRSDATCFLLSSEPCWEKQSFWFYLLGKEQIYI